MTSPVQTQPRVEVEIAGRPLEEADAATLGAVRVRQRLSLPTQCELTFFDPVGPLAKARAPDLGEALMVYVVGQAQSLFEGQVTAVEHTYGPDRRRAVRVRAYDRLHRLRKRQQIRSIDRGSLGQLIGALVAEDDLEVVVAQPDVSLTPGPALIQHQSSDYSWLAELARRAGRVFQVTAGRLHLFTLEGSGDPVALSLGDNLLEASLEANAECACDQVRAEGWDPLVVEPSRGQAADPRSGLDVAASVSASKVGGSGEVRLLDASASDDRLATLAAQAELDRRAALAVVLRGVAEGDTRLHPGRPVQLSGVAEGLTGQYVLTGAIHRIDRERGYLTEIDTEPPSLESPGPEFSALLGVVCDLEDPQGQGRVRTELPTLGGVETDWMRVLAPGAGDDKGLVALPAVGDQVLILLAHGDPAQGVVLGGLYTQAGPPDAGVEGQTVERTTLRTAGGQRLLLDDGGELLRVENADGSFVEMSPESVAFHAERDLLIEAPGRRITIRADRVDFERG